MKKFTIGGLIVATSALSIGIGIAAPAAARPIEQSRFHDVGSELLVDECGDLDVLYSWDVSGTTLGVAQGQDGLIHFRQSIHGTNVFTNTETGLSYTQLFTFHDGDLVVTDNGDGTLTITPQSSGTERWYDGQGKMVLRSSGLFRFQILVDHAGTPANPFDDVELEFLGFIKMPQHNVFEGRDFCDDLIEFTTP